MPSAAFVMTGKTVALMILYMALITFAMFKESHRGYRFSVCDFPCVGIVSRKVASDAVGKWVVVGTRVFAVSVSPVVFDIQLRALLCGSFSCSFLDEGAAFCCVYHACDLEFPSWRSEEVPRCDQDVVHPSQVRQLCKFRLC